MGRRHEGPLFSLDLRSIALFHVLVGVTILVDLAYRSLDLSAFYTDAGVLPRSLLGGHLSPLHGLSGALGWQVALVVVQGLFALAVVCGWRTKVALAGCWVLLASMNERNPLILQGADWILVYWCVYALLLPADRRFGSSRHVRSPATVLVTLQIVAIYELSALYKLGAETWTQGAVLIEAMRVDAVVTDLGRRMLAFPGLLTVAARAALALEIGGPIAVLACWRLGWARCALCFAFVAFHLLGIGLLMNVGLLSYVMAMGWALLLPGWFWDVLLPGTGVTRFAEPSPDVSPAPRRAWPWWATVAVSGVWAISWWPVGAAETGLPAPPQVLSRALRRSGLAQAKFSAWTDPVGSRRYAFPARLADGTEVDLHTGRPLDWEAVRRRPRNDHWYLLLQKLPQPRVARAVARYLVVGWNALEPPARRVDRVSVVVVQDQKMPARWWLDQRDPAAVEIPSRRIELGTFAVTYADGAPSLSPALKAPGP